MLYRLREQVALDFGQCQFLVRILALLDRFKGANHLRVLLRMIIGAHGRRGRRGLATLELFELRIDQLMRRELLILLLLTVLWPDGGLLLTSRTVLCEAPRAPTVALLSSAGIIRI